MFVSRCLVPRFGIQILDLKRAIADSKATFKSDSKAALSKVRCIAQEIAHRALFEIVSGFPVLHKGTMENAPVLVVGSFVQDLTFGTQSFPMPGETVVGKFTTGPGGKGSNQAVAARRAGADVRFVGAVGRDAFADSVRTFYEGEGIDAVLAEYPNEATGTAAILVNDSGENEIVVALGANERLSPGDIPEGIIRSSSMLICQLECNLDAVKNALARASQAGVLRILNPAPMRPDFDPALLGQADIFIPNETEFAALLALLERPVPDNQDPASLPGDRLDACCRSLGPPIVLVTLGAHGVHLSTPEGWERIPAVSGVKAIDTTGAGDAFVGAFAAGLLRFNGQHAEAARFATKASAICVSREGTAPAMARLEEIER